MGCENNYQTIIPSNRLEKRSMSTFETKLIQCKDISKDNKINPWFITGFADAESYFTISILSDIRAKNGNNIQLIFGINLHEKDTEILDQIKNSLQAGILTRNPSKSVISYRVKDIKGLKNIINHFDNYPLVSTKRREYLIFREAFSILENKSHLTTEGLTKLVYLKNLLNKGLSEKMKEAFNFNTEESNYNYNFKFPFHIFKGIPSPMWVAGFTSGDGSFFIKYFKSGESYSTGLNFSITLHIKDKDVLIGLFDYFKSYFKDIAFKNYGTRINKGIFYTDKTVSLKISSLSNINNIIIPFFVENPIQGIKALDFLDFKKVSDIITSKMHLKPEGLAEIETIRKNMNARREY